MRVQTMPFILFLMLSITGLSAANRPSSPAEFISKYSGIAIREMERSNIPASITLAQGILESSFGTSPLAINSNNFFGIKCKKTWTGDTYHEEDDDKDETGSLIKSCFRAYNTPEESFIDHTNFLMTGTYYQSLFAYDRTDYVNWAKGLQRCGYATNPAYAQLLISTIERYGLAVYDAQSARVPDYLAVQQSEPNWAFEELNPRMPPLYEIPLDYQPVDGDLTYGLPQDDGVGEAAEIYAEVTMPAIVALDDYDDGDYLFEIRPQEVVDRDEQDVMLRLEPER